MALAASASAGKRGRDESMTAAADSSVEDFRYQSKRLREWLELQQDYLLKQNDEFNEQHVAAHGDRLLEIIKSLQDEIGISGQSAAPPPPLELYASSQILPFRIGPEGDALTISDNPNYNSSFNCHTCDLKAPKTIEIRLPQLPAPAGKQSLFSDSFSVATEPRKLQGEAERSAATGAT